MAQGSRKPSDPDSDPLAQLRAGGRRREAPAADPVARPEPEAEASGILADVAVSLASTASLTDILNMIVDGIIRVSGCERGFLMLRESDGEFSTFIGRHADRSEWSEKSARAISGSVRNRVVETRELFIGSDLSQLDDFKSNESIQAGGILAAVCLPLEYKDTLIGVIYADSTRMIARPLGGIEGVLRGFALQASFAIESARSRGEVLTAKRRSASRTPEPAGRFRMGAMVSRDPAMEGVFTMVEKVAREPLTVLIQGESGTGKDLLAHAIHENSPRARKPFVAVNAGGMHDELVSSILFGHKRGAFTSAIADRAGLFELAEGGTLFLDEVGDMPAATQIKLLRVLENREMSRLGEEGTVRKVDVRVVAATNRDLAAEVTRGSFREDLFNRLRVAPVFIPPLRHRRGDILPLAAHFLARYAEEHDIAVPELSRDARARLMANPWVGNVRALRNAIELSIAFRDENNVIHADAVDRYFQEPGASPRKADTGRSLRAEMERHEEEVVRQALVENGYNVSKTAIALDISRQQLHAKIKKYGIATRDE